MEYTIREVIAQKEHSLQETVYAQANSAMLDFHLFSGDFYQWKGNSLSFKDCVKVADFKQIVEVFPPFGNVQYKSRQKLPYFTDNLELLEDAWKCGEKVAVEGGPCLFGTYEVNVIIRLKDGSKYLFDYASGKAYFDDSISETESLADYLCQYGEQVEQISFQQEKTGLTPQEYLNLRYPFEIAKALGGGLVIPIPDMSYRKYLLAILEFVPECVRIQTLEEFDLLSAKITTFYLDIIEKLQKQFQIEQFCCVHGGSQKELEVWYEKRTPYIERGKVLHSLTRLPEKLEPIKDYISMPALPFYLFDAKFILQVDSMDETDSYRKCKKAHKKAFQMGCIMLPELLSNDNTYTFYNTHKEWKDFGNYVELTENYLEGDDGF